MKVKPEIVIQIIFGFLLLIFIVLYMSQASGYYAFNNYEKMTLTKENIAKFENDVKEGKEIDVNNYLEDEVNYENKISRVSLKISNEVSKYIKKGIVGFFKKINNLIE